MSNVRSDTLPVREVRLSAGAGFIVVVCGEIMTMPGLPRTPAAETIMLNDVGEIEGLFDLFLSDPMRPCLTWRGRLPEKPYDKEEET